MRTCQQFATAYLLATSLFSKGCSAFKSLADFGSCKCLADDYANWQLAANAPNHYYDSVTDETTITFDIFLQNNAPVRDSMVAPKRIGSAEPSDWLDDSSSHPWWLSSSSSRYPPSSRSLSSSTDSVFESESTSARRRLADSHLRKIAPQKYLGLDLDLSDTTTIKGVLKPRQKRLLDSRASAVSAAADVAPVTATAVEHWDWHSLSYVSAIRTEAKPMEAEARRGSDSKEHGSAVLGEGEEVLAEGRRHRRRLAERWNWDSMSYAHLSDSGFHLSIVDNSPSKPSSSSSWWRSSSSWSSSSSSSSESSPFSESSSSSSESSSPSSSWHWYEDADSGEDMCPELLEIDWVSLHLDAECRLPATEFESVLRGSVPAAHRIDNDLNLLVFALPLSAFEAANGSVSLTVAGNLLPSDASNGQLCVEGRSSQRRSCGCQKVWLPFECGDFEALDKATTTTTTTTSMPVVSSKPTGNLVPVISEHLSTTEWPTNAPKVLSTEQPTAHLNTEESGSEELPHTSVEPTAVQSTVASVESHIASLTTTAAMPTVPSTGRPTVGRTTAGPKAASTEVPVTNGPTDEHLFAPQSTEMRTTTMALTTTTDSDSSSDSSGDSSSDSSSDSSAAVASTTTSPVIVSTTDTLTTTVPTNTEKPTTVVPTTEASTTTAMPSSTETLTSLAPTTTSKKTTAAQMTSTETATAVATTTAAPTETTFTETTTFTLTTSVPITTETLTTVVPTTTEMPPTPTTTEKPTTTVSTTKSSTTLKPTTTVMPTTTAVRTTSTMPPPPTTEKPTTTITTKSTTAAPRTTDTSTETLTSLAPTTTTSTTETPTVGLPTAKSTLTEATTDWTSTMLSSVTATEKVETSSSTSVVATTRTKMPTAALSTSEATWSGRQTTALLETTTTTERRRPTVAITESTKGKWIQRVEVLEPWQCKERQVPSVVKTGGMSMIGVIGRRKPPCAFQLGRHWFGNGTANVGVAECRCGLCCLAAHSIGYCGSYMHLCSDGVCRALRTVPALECRVTGKPIVRFN